MLSNVFLRLLASAAYFAVAHGHHAHSVPDVLGLDPALRARFDFFPRHESPPVLELRASSQTCGIQNGNTSCPQGQCCSAKGQCGTTRAFCDAPYCQLEFGPACDGNMSPQGTNTSSVARPALGSVRYADKGAIYNCTKPGYVALTYDDGPYQYTSQLLDILKQNNIPATFFITGNNLGKHPIDWANTGYPQIIQRMINEGHQIGSHTWSHQDLNTLSTQERHDQMIKNEMAFNNILGFFPTYMRPPFVSCQRNSGCLADIGALGYHLIDFNVRTYDFENLDPSEYPLTQDNVTTAMAGGNSATSDYIVFAHDILPITVHNLTQWMIDTIRAQGYKFTTVGDCLGDPMTNWYRDPTTGQGLADIVINPANASLSPAKLSAMGTVAVSTDNSTPSSDTSGSAVSDSASVSGSSSASSSASASASTSHSSIASHTYSGTTGLYLMFLALATELLL